MAIKVLVSLRDMVAEAFHAPICTVNVPSALRSLADGIQNDPAIKAHPADFVLFRLGTFDESSGLISLESSPVRLASAMDLMPKGGA